MICTDLVNFMMPTVCEVCSSNYFKEEATRLWFIGTKETHAIELSQILITVVGQATVINL